MHVACQLCNKNNNNMILLKNKIISASFFAHHAPMSDEKNAALSPNADN
jgi:hypothetical protein